MNKPRRHTTWYADGLERLVRGRCEGIKLQMIKIFEKHRLIHTFTEMQKIIGGRTQYNALAWSELRRSGEIVKCIGGYSLPGIAKHVNELMAEGRYRAKLRAPVGDAIRRKYVEDAKTLVTKLEARLLMEKKQ